MVSDVNIIMAALDHHAAHPTESAADLTGVLVRADIEEDCITVNLLLTADTR